MSKDSISINDISISPQAIHVTVKFFSNPSNWIHSIVYASTCFSTRKVLCQKLMAIIDSLGCNSRLVEGDFNEILKDYDKNCGNRISINKSYLFRNCINYYNLIDLGFRGSKYTWSNM